MSLQLISVVFISLHWLCKETVVHELLDLVKKAQWSEQNKGLVPISTSFVTSNMFVCLFVCLLYCYKNGFKTLIQMVKVIVL